MSVKVHHDIPSRDDSPHSGIALGKFSRGLIHALWRNAKVPYQAEPRKHGQDVVRDVDLPPVKSLSFRPRIVVVIVMPTFAEGDQSQEPMIAAVIG